jgi:hypothetical protein
MSGDRSVMSFGSIVDMDRFRRVRMAYWILPYLKGAFALASWSNKQLVKLPGSRRAYISH